MVPAMTTATCIVVALLLASVPCKTESQKDATWREFVERSVKEEVEEGERRTVKEEVEEREKRTDADCATAKQACTTSFYANMPSSGYDSNNGDACRAMYTLYKCNVLSDTGCVDQQSINDQLQFIAMYYQNCPSG